MGSIASVLNQSTFGHSEVIEEKKATCGL